MATKATKKRTPRKKSAKRRRTNAAAAQTSASANQTSPPATQSPMAHVALARANTDEGIAERQEKLRAEGRLGDGRVKVTADAWDKTITARQDACNGDLEPWEAPDPMREQVDRVREPGMAYRFLSERVIQHRGMRKWHPVTDEKGNHVKVGNQFLAKMPEELAEKRNRYYRDKSSNRVRTIAESYRERQERLIRDARTMGLEVMHPGEAGDGYDPDLARTGGIAIHRGNA